MKAVRRKVGKLLMNTQTKQNGFTIIEVVLVLAIAALIFLMVFIALPALQRGQRDTQRKADLGRLQTAIQKYQSNNRNQLPNFGVAAQRTAFITGYLNAGGDTFADPDGTNYSLTNATLPTVFTPGPIRYQVGATCNGEQLNTTNQGTSKVAFQYRLEGGGIACVNN